jgi:hypothetical protein
MVTLSRGKARVRSFVRLCRGAPLAWLIAGGVVLLAATAVATALTVDRFRQNAIENGREGLESAVLLLTRQFEDFSVLQKSIAAEFEDHDLRSPEIFQSEMATLAVHELLRAKARGWSDVAGANVFDARGVLINSYLRWPVQTLVYPIAPIQPTKK